MLNEKVNGHLHFELEDLADGKIELTLIHDCCNLKDTFKQIAVDAGLVECKEDVIVKVGSRKEYRR
jgi:hypothetical protein